MRANADGFGGRGRERDARFEGVRSRAGSSRRWDVRGGGSGRLGGTVLFSLDPFSSLWKQKSEDAQEGKKGVNKGVDGI